MKVKRGIRNHMRLTPKIEPDNSEITDTPVFSLEKRMDGIQASGIEIIERMLGKIQQHLSHMNIFDGKEEIHPFYKIVFTETVKRCFKPNLAQNDEAAERLTMIGIEGFDREQL